MKFNLKKFSKMLDKHLYFPVLVLLSVCFEYASSIHCYECTSVNNSMCLDPTIYDAQTLEKYLHMKDCNDHGFFHEKDNKYFCRKIVQTLLRKGEKPEVRVSRGCGWVRHRRACYTADNEDHLETACQCDTDACNSAHALLPAALGPATLLTVACYFLAGWYFVN